MKDRRKSRRERRVAGRKMTEKRMKTIEEEKQKVNIERKEILKLNTVYR